MPGPTEVGRPRSALARGGLIALVVIALVAAAAVVSLRLGRHTPVPDAAITAAPSTEQATLDLVPAPGATGAATCTDPVGRQQWRVTWRAATATATPAPATPRPWATAEMTPGAGVAHAAGAAVPTSPETPDSPETPPVPGTTVPGNPVVPGTAVPAATAPGSAEPGAAGPAATASPGPSGSTTPTTGPTTDPTSGLGAELLERAAAVTLIPTGFAVRPLPAEPGSAPASSAATPAPGTTANNGTTNASAGATPTTPATPADGWVSRDAATWLLRWSPNLADTLTAAANETWQREGPLATLAGIPMSVRQDPRFVTPDGACSVYLAPFVAGTAGERNSVAVIGDSLVAQLYASEDGTPTGTGTLLNRLVAAGDQVEIAGQGGRRWTIKPDPESSLTAADASMLDEIRGLREARSVGIALGTNDAGWVAHGSTRELYELRLAWVLLHLAPILDELRDDGHCTVVTTMATRNKTYIDTRPGSFDAAATRINDYLRERADADPNDRLKLWDWAATADGHGTNDPEPWFGRDTIHLNQAGHAAYADALTSAAALC